MVYRKMQGFSSRSESLRVPIEWDYGLKTNSSKKTLAFAFAPCYDARVIDLGGIMSPNYKAKKCATCGDLFTPTTPRVMYCSEECRRGTAVCSVCGKTFLKKGNTTGLYCSPECWYAKPNKNDHPELECPICERTFVERQPGQKYCSTFCAHAARRTPLQTAFCENCGNKMEFKIGRSKRFCSRKCHNESTGKDWQEKPIGHKHLGPNGYVVIKVGRGHPGAYAAGTMLEHRYVMQEKLGRPLENGEHVHHINGDRTDNRPENLELWKGAHPPGVRVT
jgi:HNH endonuclease